MQQPDRLYGVRLRLSSRNCATGADIAIHGNKADEKKIYLQKDESANRVVMTSEQFSQEAGLGTRATYDLTLELFSSVENVYKLEALNLPRQVTSEFLDAQTGARFSQVSSRRTSTPAGSRSRCIRRTGRTAPCSAWTSPSGLNSP